jgi:hypothetical protein
MGGLETSVGIWALGPMVTRFVPGGYRPERPARPDDGTESGASVGGE